MSFNKEEAVAIAAELQKLHDEARSLIADAASGRHHSDELHARVVTLKAAIKEGAKYETLSRRREPKTDLEQCFFGPAMRSASSNFRMKTNTNPKGSAWAAGLHEVEFEISYYLHNLNEYIKENA